MRGRMAAVPLSVFERNGPVARGFTAIELLLVMAVGITIAAMAVPLASDVLDRIRTAMAARYLEGRIMDARMQAIRRSARVALRFEPVGRDYAFAEYLDGNGNGVRNTDIGAGVDPMLTPPQSLDDHFPGVTFGLEANVPEVDGTVSSSAGDGVRIGASRLLTLGPDGTATSGTLYVHGRTGQYAVRIFGATGRTRVLRYNAGTRRWGTS